MYVLVCARRITYKHGICVAIRSVFTSRGVVKSQTTRFQFRKTTITESSKTFSVQTAKLKKKIQVPFETENNIFFKNVSYV